MDTKVTRRIITGNLYNGEKALRNFRAQFPLVLSNTRYNCLIERHKTNKDYAELIPALKGKSILAGLVMSGIRNTYNQAKDKINYLKAAVKNQKTANCQEQAFLIHNELKEMGIPSQNVRINFVQKDSEQIHKNHAFTVIGLDKDADIQRPHTWGKNAVIVDAWANTVKRAQEGIEYLKEIFKYNPEKEDCVFSYHRNI